MDKEKDIKKIPENTRRNFETVSAAFKNGSACIMRARRISDGQHVTLICAMTEHGEEIAMTPFAVMLAEDGNPFEQFIPAADPEFDLPTAEELDNHGNAIDAYPVDESQTVSNAGDAVLYELNGKKYQVIVWNENATEHEPGSKEVSEIPEDEE